MMFIVILCAAMIFMAIARHFLSKYGTARKKNAKYVFILLSFLFVVFVAALRLVVPYGWYELFYWVSSILPAVFALVAAAAYHIYSKNKERLFSAKEVFHLSLFSSSFLNVIYHWIIIPLVIDITGNGL